jgi:hypothetical protein
MKKKSEDLLRNEVVLDQDHFGYHSEFVEFLLNLDRNLRLFVEESKKLTKMKICSSFNRISSSNNGEKLFNTWIALTWSESIRSFRF